MSRLTNPPQLYARTDCPICGAFGFVERNKRRRNGSGWLESRKCTMCGKCYDHRVCDVIAQALDRRYPAPIVQGSLFDGLALPHPTPPIEGVQGLKEGDSLTHA